MIEVKLIKDDYVNYLSHQIEQGSSYRGHKIWVILSVPILLAIILLYFKDYTKISYLSAAIILTILWIFFGSPWLLKLRIKQIINNQLLPKLHIVEFQSVKYQLTKNGIKQIENKKTIQIPYTQIRSFVPFQDMIIIYHKNGVMILPYRAFSNDKALKDFTEIFEQNWQSHTEN